MSDGITDTSVNKSDTNLTTTANNTEEIGEPDKGIVIDKFVGEGEVNLVDACVECPGEDNDKVDVNQPSNNESETIASNNELDSQVNNDGDDCSQGNTNEQEIEIDTIQCKDEDTDQEASVDNETEDVSNDIVETSEIQVADVKQVIADSDTLKNECNDKELNEDAKIELPCAASDETDVLDDVKASESVNEANIQVSEQKEESENKSANDNRTVESDQEVEQLISEVDVINETESSLTSSQEKIKDQNELTEETLNEEENDNDENSKSNESEKKVDNKPKDDNATSHQAIDKDIKQKSQNDNDSSVKSPGEKDASHRDRDRERYPKEKESKSKTYKDIKEKPSRYSETRERSNKDSRERSRRDEKGSGKKEEKPSRFEKSKDDKRSTHKSGDTKSRFEEKGVAKSKSEMGTPGRFSSSRGRKDSDHSKTDKDQTKFDKEPARKKDHLAQGDSKSIDKNKEASKGETHKEKSDKAKNKAPTAAELEAELQREAEEKIRKAEEEKKKVEEKIKAEEERQRKIEEDKAKAFEEEKKSVEEYAIQAKEIITWKEELREKNSHAEENRPEDSFFSKLDSKVKKNTAFVNKLRNLTETQKDALTKEFNSLNLNRYIGECAAAITEAKLKMSDIPCAVHMCSLLHQRYADFAPALLENWHKVLMTKKDEKVPNASKLRVDLRFFAELISVKLFTMKEGLPLLSTQLSVLINNDKEDHNNLPILISFCKHCGDDYAGYIPRKFRILAEKHNVEIPRSKLLPPERQKACNKIIKTYFDSLAIHLKNDHTDLKTMEKVNRKVLQTKGELSPQRTEQSEAMVTAFSKLHANTLIFADIINEDMPELPEDEKDADGGMDFFDGSKLGEYQYEGEGALFEDEETRAFYETLPDLKEIIPRILYKDSAPAAPVEKTPEETTAEEDLNVEDIEKELAIEGEKIKQEEKNKSKKDGDKDNNDDAEHPVLVDIDDEVEDTTGASMKMELEAFLQSLPQCVNRDLIDSASVDFCMKLNIKTNRKKLTKALFTVQRTRYDLLPFYSRFVATLFPIIPDVANDLMTFLKGDFKWHVRKKDQINIESKIKTTRFLGELVKFKILPKSEVLHCLKMLLFDFSHHNIEMACALLETCGRFLYRSPDSHHRTKVYLEVMMRKKTALHLSSRYNTMIENAFYYSNPPEIAPIEKKVRPPMHEYIRKLLYKDLSKTNIEKVLKQLRRLDWDDKQISFYATKCLIAIWNIKFNCIHCVANLLAGLAPYHEHVAISVVDALLEEVRLGMEMNHPKYNQRRISVVKYLGELYNYRMVESGVIFKMLYSFITFGVSLDENTSSPLDQPEHLFRLRLACCLLDTCGQYFDRGSSKRKLDCYLVYLQRYYWFKKKNPIWNSDRPFPMDVEYNYRDTIEPLRPKMQYAENYEEACQLCEELETEIKKKLANVLPIIETDGSQSEGEASDGLGTIREDDENMDELSQRDRGADLTEESESEGNNATSSQNQTTEGEEEDESEDMLESAGEDESEDQVTVLNGGLKVIKCEEDDGFLADFEKMMADNIQARNRESLKVPTLDIAVPVHVRTQMKSKTVALPGGLCQSAVEEEEEEVKNTLNFMLMTRKGNKQQFSTLNVPMTAEFAAKFRERAQAERAEKERVKRVVLDMHERQEAEDYEELIASMNRPATTNTNRERKVKYSHPKGAPDADLIFGSKKTLR
ncbi:unnamed protein product [Owenia fusiformis]|uniref:Regulator of nonsense transcripts 2 n=1 Tax=Owenia fusiformis TaxID=6347 RepID=A0A8J1T5W6_OWEFU|nr:unnamed protein product [Owenia fusiformis]